MPSINQISVLQPVLGVCDRQSAKLQVCNCRANFFIADFRHAILVFATCALRAQFSFLRIVRNRKRQKCTGNHFRKHPFKLVSAQQLSAVFHARVSNMQFSIFAAAVCTLTERMEFTLQNSHVCFLVLPCSHSTYY